MHRQIVYPAAIPLDTDFLNQNKNTMLGLGYLMQAVLGTTTVLDGLACTPTGPATLTVNISSGSIYTLAQIDGTAYGSIAADTVNQIVKQGIVTGVQNFACPAPVTVGQSVIYLIQAAYQDLDGGSTVLPYYNAANPSAPYSGPGNTGTSQNTVRQGLCTVQIKTGVAATTGSQITPTPDVGFTGLYAITVANGQSTVTSGNIVQLSTAPFITPKLPSVMAAVQAGVANSAIDTSGSANTIAISLSPAVTSITFPLRIWVKVANTNTGAVVINTNGLGNVSATRQDGSAIQPGQLQANGIYPFVYDGSHWQLTGSSTRFALSANTTFFVATTGNDSNPGTVGSPWLTIQHAINFLQSSVDLNGFNVTISVGTGTYTGAIAVTGPFFGGSQVTLQGDTTTPSNVIISTTSNSCISLVQGAILNIAGFKLQTTTSGDCLRAGYNSVATLSGKMEFAACAGFHMHTFNNGVISANQNYTISGSALGHVKSEATSTIENDASTTTTLTGTPAFSVAFAVATANASVLFQSNTFSGSATGSRYNASLNGVVSTNTGNTSFLPGNAAGTTATGGQYS